MAFTLAPEDGVKFAFGPWPNCAIGAYETGGVGQIVFIGIGAVGSMDYNSVGTLWGPGDISSVGDLGAFITGLIPAACAVLKAKINLELNDAALPHDAPATVQNVNIGLRQYVKVVPEEKGKYPVASIKAYP